LFIVEQAGRIKIIKDGSLNTASFLDISGIVNQGGDERGLLGMAFHPNYASNGYFYVNYIDRSLHPGDTIIARYQVSANPDTADLSSGVVLLTINQLGTNHNGGWMAFSPLDGYLYVSSGDGGGPGGSINAQDKDSLLGKILRLDVDAVTPYAPPSNPFFGTIPGDDRIWAVGLRNPWRCSFDRINGDLWVGDVGEIAREEINFQIASSIGGENYGWNIAEGFECRGGGGNCGSQIGFTPPVHDYPRADGTTVVCGYVYRGTAIPGLQGTFFFADYLLGSVWSFNFDGANVDNFVNRTSELDPSGPRTIRFLASFGEDSSGELYIIDYSDGEVFKLVDGDTDGDGLGNGAEVNIYGTDPLNSDTDHDGIADGNEVYIYGSNPTITDTDGDRIPDGIEVINYGTNPTLPDTDGDYIHDNTEIVNGTNPNNKFDFPEFPLTNVAGTLAIVILLAISGLFSIKRKNGAGYPLQ